MPCSSRSLANTIADCVVSDAHVIETSSGSYRLRTTKKAWVSKVLSEQVFR